jgi:hypothetical protein
VIVLFVGALLWCLLDSFARATAGTLRLQIVGGMVLINVALPIARMLWERLSAANTRLKDKTPPSLMRKINMGAIALVLGTFLVFALDVLAHSAFDTSSRLGIWTLLFALAVSLAIGRATNFVNVSSLQSAYASRLARTFLGASSPSRVFAQGSAAPPDVSTSHPDDDLPFNEYHPERSGGPLHLINVCVNETADAVSGRHLAEDKGLSMCVGPTGVSVGVRYHALWDSASSTRLRALPLGADPESFHVLAQQSHEPIEPEPLRLSQWMSISGAAYSTGAGRNTNLATALLLGLLNIRFGYWWNTRVDPGNRPGRFPPTFINRLTGLPGFIFRTQQMILNEWRGYFPGPASRYWYLSDGGHYENTGLYELLRRRVAFMIAVDSGEDSKYVFDDLAWLVRRARLDFGAELEWVDPAAARESGSTGWAAIDSALGTQSVPQWIKEWLNPDELGPLSGITRDGKYGAALARVRYHGGPAESWLVLLKPSLTAANTSVDLRCYSMLNPKFPNQPTKDQLFDADQWESYRVLGEISAGELFNGLNRNN